MATATEPITYDNINLCNSCKYNKEDCDMYDFYSYEGMIIVRCDKFKFKENPFTKEYISIWRSGE